MRSRSLLPLLLLALGACRGAPPRSAPALPSGPYAMLLGSAQDGGLPQLACEAEPCRAARADPGRARYPTALLLVDPASGTRWLFDATPRLAEQWELARALGAVPSTLTGSARPPLFDAVFLTHAHYGHLAGLALFGREVYGAGGQLVRASPRLIDFLARTPPYDLYVAQGQLRLEPLALATPTELAPGLSVECLRVPHREEWSDTLAFVLHGPERSLLYLPDIDKWERWELELEQVLARVDYALVDGTFYAEGEVAGRSMAEIPHPFVQETLARLARLPARERAKLVFVHLNHSNPAADERGEAARTIHAAGMRVGREGLVFPLGESALLTSE